MFHLDILKKNMRTAITSGKQEEKLLFVSVLLVINDF